MREKVICFIDETDQCFSNWAREIIKNISDQTHSALASHYPIFFNTIPDTNKQVIVVHTGIDVMYLDPLQHISSDDDVIVLRDNLPKGVFYLDGSNEENFVKGMGWQYHKFMSGTAVLFYATNNEPTQELPIGKIQQLIHPAAGINWIDYLLKYGYDQTTVVRFIDCNYLALSCMKEIVEWDGVDYPAFIKQLGASKFEFLGMPWNIGIKNIHNLDTDWQAFIERHPNWLIEWSKIKQSVKFEFRYVNLYDINNNVVDWIDDTPNTFINFSNVFNYFTAGALCTTTARLIAETHLINQLKEHRPNALVAFSGRISDLFSPNNIKLGLAKDINTVPYQQTTVPWHKND